MVINILAAIVVVILIGCLIGCCVSKKFREGFLGFLGDVLDEI